MRRMIPYFVCSFMGAALISSAAAVTEADSLALVALYDSTDGANWNITWDLNTPVDTWNGVTVDGGLVIGLELGNNNLSDSIPAELGNLANLGHLSLHSNQLTGSIPAELGNLANLTYLNIGGNQLTGSIPAELGNLANLTELWLYSNQLTDSIPAELGNLANLTWLYLSGNQLSGSIPAELGNLANLRSLALYYNQLSGSIPAELGNLANLRRLYLSSNQLSGSIPAELGNLTNLWWFTLWSNQLSGSIPAELGNLVNLIELVLHSNQLSGSIPAELGNLANLTHLLLFSNQLSGLPDLSTLAALSNLQVENNRFTFEDIEPNIGISNFTYAPQDSVGAAIDTTLDAGEALTLSIAVGGSANVYQWRKDGVDIAGATSDTLSLPSVTSDDAGAYYLKITNTIATDLTLHSRPIYVTVGDLAVLGAAAVPIPQEFALHPAYPNPFNPATTIRYDLPEAVDVILVVYDLVGREVARLVDGHVRAGYHQVVWQGRTADGREIPTGIYIARMFIPPKAGVAPEYTRTIKMVMMK